ncbi:preprotein translocase subunit TatB [Janthinobacterium sp. 17J80-10]|uniref:preprotein translocase subunit TatB n=1 Tax=Janthinobacterium sp. 17J80-10 TaxID=2497863 RepID=UPI001005A23A|nr:preprotein translocase subunit TatB [Janthinobacterium sp. 17J80-10]QAU33913.1 preprotein translocase subunit TatB [Janthinobacterium sp. 17J80-10]
MKILILRLWVMCRRLGGGVQHRRDRRIRYERQVESLLLQANPFASWNERANWVIDVAAWLRHVPRTAMLRPAAAGELRRQRLLFLLDWLDAHRDIRRVVQTTLQKTLREAAGPELFSTTGLPREPAFFSELGERLVKLVLPRPPAQHDLAALFAAMFPDPADAGWLLTLDHATMTRLAKLCTDEGIRHAYIRQIDEALTYLAAMIVAVGIGPAFRQRLDPKVPLQATPFMALRRELEKYCLSRDHDVAALRSVKMLVAVCQAQTDRIYADLDEHGVSVGLVYSVERMRAQLVRIGRLLDLRTATLHTPQGAGQVQALLADLICAQHARDSVPALVQRSFSLLARKLVERNASRGEHYIARNRSQYNAMLKAACVGGVVTAFTVLAKYALVGAEARFFDGLSASLTYAASFMLITALGGVLATKQPAVTAPALAARMGALDSLDGLRALMQEIASLLRSQAAAVFGNLMAVIPAMALLAGAVLLATGTPLLAPEKARASLDSLSLFGVTPLFAALTGILLWISSLVASFADNWFALRQLRASLAHHRRLVHALGTARAERLAHWVERHVASVAGNLSLAFLLGMGPAVSQFFGLGLDVRHVTLATGTLVAAAASLGSSLFLSSDFWLAVLGIVTIGLLNVGVAFAFALALALRAREVPERIRRLVFRTVLRHFARSPRAFLFAQETEAGGAGAAKSAPEPEVEETRRAGGA